MGLDKVTEEAVLELVKIQFYTARKYAQLQSYTDEEKDISTGNSYGRWRIYNTYRILQ